MKRLDHIAIAVRDLDAAVDTLSRALGLECTHQETVAGEQVRTAFLPVGETHLELLESTHPEGPVGRFVEKRGEGIHHLCFEVEDLDQALARCREQGLTPLGDPRAGARGTRVVFLHPRSAHGVLIELCERSRESRT